MGKLKTKKSISKRFKLTKKGKVKYRPCGGSHVLSNKKPSRLRKIRKAKTVSNKKLLGDLRAMLPYG